MHLFCLTFGPHIYIFLNISFQTYLHKHILQAELNISIPDHLFMVFYRINLKMTISCGRLVVKPFQQEGIMERANVCGKS